jgi:hypothetical protein
MTIEVRGLMIALPIQPGMHIDQSSRVKALMTKRTAACNMFDNTARAVWFLVTARQHI